MIKERKERIKRIFDLHAWLGVIIGLFLFIVSFSGVIALFGGELRTWENPASRLVIPEKTVSLDWLIESLIQEKVGEDKIVSLVSDFPTPKSPFYTTYLATESTEGDRTISRQYWNSATGEEIAKRGKGFSYWLADFHRHLMLPRIIGRTLVGLAGILMLLAIITGVLTHKRIIKDLFSWRIDKTMRLRWRDSHNALGIWGLPFHTMIAFTGAFLGMVTLLVPLIGVMAFEGDKGAVTEAVFGEPRQATGISAPMVSFDKAREDVFNKTGRLSNRVSVEFWGDSAAEFEFLLAPEKELIIKTQIIVNAVTGDVGEEIITSLPGIGGRLTGALAPLHYATYGGIWLKILYMVLGIGLCLMIVTGLSLWVERRRYGNAGNQPDAFYDYLSRFITGVISGLVLASFSVFYVDRLISVLPENRIQVIGIAYFSVWILATIYSLTQKNGYRTNKRILGLSAVLLIFLPFLDISTTLMSNQSVFNGHYEYVEDINWLAFVSGLVLFFCLKTLPNSRPKKK